MANRRMFTKMLGVVLALGLADCGDGNSIDGPPPPSPSPSPTQAAVTFNVDPQQIVANDAGNDWYRFKATWRSPSRRESDTTWMRFARGCW